MTSPDETSASASPVLRSLSTTPREAVREQVHEAAGPFRRRIRLPIFVPERRDALILVYSAIATNGMITSTMNRSIHLQERMHSHGV